MFLQFCGGAAVTGLFGVIMLLINRAFSKKDKQETDADEKDKRIEALEALAKTQQKSLERAERDNCRIQMLIMMMHYPEEKTEIMKLAEHYFKPKALGGLEGDWYMTGIFNTWLTKNGIGKPEWFNSEG